VNCFRNFSGTNGQAVRIGVSLSCAIPIVDDEL